MDALLEKRMKETELIRLKAETGDSLVLRFMNDDNGEKLDEKIEVCKRLIDGESPDDIENYYDVLDDMPQDKDDERVFW